MISALWQKWRWDGLGLWLAGLCLLHCLLTVVFIAALASAAGILLHPMVHEIGLMLAIILGAAALGKGFLRHGRTVPVAIGAGGLAIMAYALTIPHSNTELFYTIFGLLLLIAGHYANHRALQ